MTVDIKDTTIGIGGGTVRVPSFEIDEYGHIKATGFVTLTLPDTTVTTEFGGTTNALTFTVKQAGTTVGKVFTIGGTGDYVDVVKDGETAKVELKNIVTTAEEQSASDKGSNKLATTAWTIERINNTLAQVDAMRFKGVIPAGADKTTDLPTNYLAGDVYKVGAAIDGLWGGPNDVNSQWDVEAGDLVICIKDFAGTATLNDFMVVQSNIDGAVTATSPGNADHIAMFDGNGRIIKDAGWTIKGLTDYVDSSIHTHRTHVATDSSLGHIKIGYSENAANFAVKLADDKAYVTVPYSDYTFTVGGDAAKATTTWVKTPKNGSAATTVTTNFVGATVDSTTQSSVKTITTVSYENNEVKVKAEASLYWIDITA